jgi:hypothetical protein
MTRLSCILWDFFFAIARIQETQSINVVVIQSSVAQPLEVEYIVVAPIDDIQVQRL